MGSLCIKRPKALNTSAQYCSNGPCVVCNFQGGQRALCADQSNPSRDFCNAPQYLGLCICPDGSDPQVVTNPTVQTTAGNTIGIDFIEPLVPLTDFQGDQIIPELEPADTNQPEALSEPDYQGFLVPRGLARDHIRGETSK